MRVPGAQIDGVAPRLKGPRSMGCDGTMSSLVGANSHISAHMPGIPWFGQASTGKSSNSTSSRSRSVLSYLWSRLRIATRERYCRSVVKVR